MELPLYGPSRRTRGGANSSNHAAACLVDGCNSDLSKSRDYHRRHKVCEVHSKTPKVTIRGEEQRFCQQCSRFHSLVEFDDVKRSCRKRLDGHNRRRRKSQPESSLLNPTEFHPDFQDAAKYFQPTGPQVFPTASWSRLGAVIPKSSDDFFSGSSSRRHEMTWKERIQFPFLQDTQQEPPTLLRAPSISSAQQLIVPESNRALSLLSSLQQPHPETSPEKCVNLFNSSQPLHHHHHPNPDYDYDQRVGLDHQTDAAHMLVSHGSMFFQIRHDVESASSMPPLHLDRRSPSSWED